MMTEHTGVIILLSTFRYYDKVALLDAIRSMPYEPFGTTFTADALEAMRTLVRYLIDNRVLYFFSSKAALIRLKL